MRTNPQTPPEVAPRTTLAPIVDWALRACGLALLAASAALARVVVALAGQLPGRESPGEFAAALLAVAALGGGIALLGFGAGLFAPAPVPPRAMLP